MKTIFTFSHPQMSETYRDFPSQEMAELYRAEVAEDMELPAHELAIETFEVDDDEFDELMDRAGFAQFCSYFD